MVHRISRFFANMLSLLDREESFSSLCFRLVCTHHPPCIQGRKRQRTTIPSCRFLSLPCRPPRLPLLNSSLAVSSVTAHLRTLLLGLHKSSFSSLCFRLVDCV